VTGLDDVGRLMVFIVDLENDKLLKAGANSEFFIPRFNRVYFDPSKLMLAAAVEFDFEAGDSEDVKVNVHYSKIIPGTGMRFERKIKMSGVDFDVVISPAKLF
jgi:hypothetical protein